MNRPEIVLVEDNPGDVLLVQMALRESGIPHSLTLFETGQDAVHSLCDGTETQIVPDVILLDLNTPGTDGFEALVKLSQSTRLAGARIAILTSSRARSDKHRAAIHGVRYIEKPSHLQEFLDSVGGAVKEMLAQRH